MKYRGNAHKSGRKRKESEREKKNRHILKLHIQLWIAFTLTIFFFPLHLIFFSTYYRFVIRNSRKMGLLSSKWLLYQLKVSDQHLDSFDKITKPNEIAWMRAEMEHILTGYRKFGERECPINLGLKCRTHKTKKQCREIGHVLC